MLTHSCSMRKACFSTVKSSTTWSDCHAGTPLFPLPRLVTICILGHFKAASQLETVNWKVQSRLGSTMVGVIECGTTGFLGFVARGMTKKTNFIMIYQWESQCLFNRKGSFICGNVNIDQRVWM